jgi:YedE family putative selenium metabolism protein
MLLRAGGPLLGVAGLLAGVVITNLALGQFHVGYSGQPLAQPDWLPSLVSMGAVGLSATLLGGCPFRQTVMAASGDTDAASAVLGMVVGVVAAHALGTVSSPAGAAAGSGYLLAGVWIALLAVGFIGGVRVVVPVVTRRLG